MLWRAGRLPCATRAFRISNLSHERSSPITAILPLIRHHGLVRSLSTAPPEDAIADQHKIGNLAGAALLEPSLTNHADLLSDPTPLESPIIVAGLVRSIRKHKKVAFAHVSDGSTYQPIQAILRPEDAKDIQNGAYVEIQGSWKKSLGKGQSHEMHVDQVLRIGQSDPEESPIQKKSMTVDHLRNHPHLRLRTPLYSLLARVRAQVIKSVHEFYADRALYVQPPLITSSDCEGAGEVFTVTPKSDTVAQSKKVEDGKEQHYFRSPKYLTVSSQLHLEAFAAELGDVWTLSPAFRAEESDTARHLSELTMLEAEFRGITEIDELTSRTKGLVRHIAMRFQESPVSQELVDYYSDAEHRPEGSSGLNINDRWDNLLNERWQTITYRDAIAELESAASRDSSLFKSRPSWENGLQLEHERWLTQNLGGDAPVFVTHYPMAQKPFYMVPSSTGMDPEDPQSTVACFDLLLPHGACEVVGGSLREHRLENLITNMRQKGLLSSNKSVGAATVDPSADVSSTLGGQRYPYLKEGESLNSLAWYADLRRFGSSPHGGFGLGFDRLLMYLTGVSNVRDIVGFPRTFGRADC